MHLPSQAAKPLRQGQVGDADSCPCFAWVTNTGPAIYAGLRVGGVRLLGGGERPRASHIPSSTSISSSEKWGPSGQLQEYRLSMMAIAQQVCQGQWPSLLILHT